MPKRQLLEDELERTARTARGELSALEAACGVAPPVQSPAPALAAYANAAVLLKFEVERADVVTAELAEIEALQAAGKCRAEEAMLA